MRHDLQAAIIALTMARLWSKQPGKLQDYVLHFGSQRVSSVRQQFMAMCAFRGIKVSKAK